MKKLVFLILAIGFISFLLYSIPAQTKTKGNEDFYIEYYFDECPLVKYTPNCLGECHLPIKFKYDGRLAPETITLTSDKLKWFIKKKIGNPSIKKIEIRMLKNTSYRETVWVPDVVCEPGVENETSCVDKGHYEEIERYKYEWKRVKFPVTLKKGKFYCVDFVGYRKPELGISGIDIAPNIYGYSFSEFAWWNSSWFHRREITINNSNNPKTLTNYSLLINISYDSDMQANFSDLRFTWYNSTSNEEMEIPYWIENYRTSEYAEVWIKIPEIPGSGTTTVYMYYGNPSAESKSDLKQILTLTELNTTLDTTGGDYGNNFPLFQKPENNHTYLIGYNYANPISKYWDGSSWVSDNSFASGMGGHSAYHAVSIVPYEVLNEFGIFESYWANSFYNYYKYWDGSSWVSDNSKLPQPLPPDEDYSGGQYNKYYFVKNSTGHIILIRHDCYATPHEDHFWWNGSTWINVTGSDGVAEIVPLLRKEYTACGGGGNWFYWLGKYSNPTLYHFSYNLIFTHNSTTKNLIFFQYDPNKNEWKRIEVENPYVTNFNHLGHNFNLLNESSNIYRLLLPSKFGAAPIKFYETGFYRTDPEPTYSIGEEISNLTYMFRKPIIINNTQNSNDLIDYQIAINLTYDSDMQYDFSDIRFTNSSSYYENEWEIEYPYWIESKVDGSWAKVWVKIDEIPASSTKTIYVYYGNITPVASESNGTNTFYLYIPEQSVSYSTSSTSYVTANTWTATFPDTPVKWQYLNATVRNGDDANGYWSQYVRVRVGDDTNYLYFGDIHSGIGCSNINTTPLWGDSSGSYNPTGKRFSCDIVTSSAKDTYPPSITPFSGNQVVKLEHRVDTSGKTGHITTIKFIIRAYADPEPTYEIESEEICDTVPPIWNTTQGYLGSNATWIPEGGTIKLFAMIKDNYELDKAWLETNETGIWENKTRLITNTLSDSSTAKNVTFGGNENKTEYIKLPKEANVIDASLSLKGYEYTHYSSCKGESCTAPSEGVVVATQQVKGSLRRCAMWGYNYFYVADVDRNYVNSSSSGGVSRCQLLTNINTGCQLYNCYPGYPCLCSDCSGDFVSVNPGETVTCNVETPCGIYSKACYYSDCTGCGSYVTTYCSCTVYMNWTQTNNATNPYLDVSNDGDIEWSYSGEFNYSVSPSKATDLSDEMNDYLSTCSPDSEGYCNIPLIIHSDTVGKIEISDIYVESNYHQKSVLDMQPNSNWQWANFTWKNLSISRAHIGWRICFNDTAGNVNCTPINTFIVGSPKWSNNQTEINPPYQKSYFNITWTDAFEQGFSIKKVLLENNFTGVPNNITLVDWEEEKAYYRFDTGSGTTLVDSSGNGNDGIISGASWVSGKFGNALEFDGENDYVNISDSPSLSLKNMTITFWFYPKSTKRRVLQKQLEYDFYINDNSELEFWFSDGSFWYGGSSEGCYLSVSLNQWHFVAAEVNTSGIGKLYVDGNIVTCQAYEPFYLGDTSSPLRLGTTIDSQQFFNGTLDELRIFNRTLTDEEISYLYNQYHPDIYNYSTNLPDYGWYYWKSYAQATDGVWNSTDTWYFEVADTVPPEITFISQTPSNLNESSTDPVTIIINITDINGTGINLSRVAFFTGINHTLAQDFFHYNWSWRYPANPLQPDMRRAENRNMSYWFEDVVFKESPDDIWTFAGYDNTTPQFNILSEGADYVTLNITFYTAQDMFPQIFPISKKYLTLENKTDQYISLHKNNWIKIKFYPSVFYNYSTENYTIYLSLDIDPSFSPDVKPLEIYFCNESYTTGDPLNSDYCSYVEEIDSTDTRLIIMNQSSYIQNVFFIANGYVDGIKVTDEAYIVLRTNVPEAKAFRLYYADDEINQYINFSNFNHAWLSTDSGSSWNQISYTPDFYIVSTQAERDKVMYYVYACDNYNNCVNSSVQYDSLDPVNHPPTEPLILKPTADENVTGLYNITWTTLGDPDFDPYNVSVYLCNPDGSINTTLADNNVTQDKTYYEFNASEFPTGKYRINVTLCDIHNLCSSSLTAYNFTIYKQYNKTLYQSVSPIESLFRQAGLGRALEVVSSINFVLARQQNVIRTIIQDVSASIYMIRNVIPYLQTQISITTQLIKGSIKEIYQSVGISEIGTSIRIKVLPLTVNIATEVKRSSILIREIIAKPLVSLSLKIVSPIRYWLTLESPPYPLFEWFTRVENLVLLFVIIGFISTLSIAWIWHRRGEMFKPGILRFFEKAKRIIKRKKI